MNATYQITGGGIWATMLLEDLERLEGELAEYRTVIEFLAMVFKRGKLTEGEEKMVREILEELK